jgi:hypothetical protein
MVASTQRPSTVPFIIPRAAAGAGRNVAVVLALRRLVPSDAVRFPALRLAFAAGRRAGPDRPGSSLRVGRAGQAVSMAMLIRAPWNRSRRVRQHWPFQASNCAGLLPGSASRSECGELASLLSWSHRARSAFELSKSRVRGRFGMVLELGGHQLPDARVRRRRVTNSGMVTP